MGFAETYYKRFAVSNPRIQEKPSKNLEIVLVIPCFSEPDILKTLTSFLLCSKVNFSIEIIVVINFSEQASTLIKEENIRSFESITSFALKHNRNDFSIHAILADNLPKKHAGVGFARKIGMDEAVHRFNSNNNPHGIICCCDADTFVEENYFTEIHAFFTSHNCGIATIHFEHPLSGNLPKHMYSAIAQYELHLRLYVEALKNIDFPFAYHTVGSSMAVRADAYCRQGGMNKRQAGEDFYFLQKLFQAENVGVITGTTIIPASRISHRVPFGTGHAMKEMMLSENPVYYTYNLESYEVLSDFFRQTPNFFSGSTHEIEDIYTQLHPSLREFLPENDCTKKIIEIKSHASSYASFRKRFFLWMNGFMIFKYLNTSHLSHFKKPTVIEASKDFLNTNINCEYRLLHTLRNIQKQSN